MARRCTGSAGALIGTLTTDNDGNIAVTSGSKDSAIICQNRATQYPAGAKIWLVLTSDYASAQA